MSTTIRRLLLVAAMLLAGCNAPGIEVTEVLNHGICKTLDRGISRVAFADLANIRGTQFLREPGTTPPATEASAAADVLLLAVSNGPQPTPGYAFELQSVGGDRAEVRLEYHWIEPEPGAVMAQMMTAPCSVVQIAGDTPPAAVSAWLDGELVGRFALTQ